MSKLSSAFACARHNFVDVVLALNRHTLEVNAMSDGLGKQGSNDTAERKLNALFWVAAIAGSAVWSFQDVLSWNVCFVVSGLLDAVMWVTILEHHPSSKKGKIAIAAVVLAFSMLTALPMS